MKRSPSMKHLPSIIAVCLLAAGCSFRPSPEDLVLVVDTPASVKACKKLGEIAGPLSTVPGELRGQMTPMRQSVVAMGGNVLLLKAERGDWSVVRAVAYSCKDSPNIGW